MIMLAVDPGLDGVGGAFFDVRQFRLSSRSPVEAIKSWVGTFNLTTDPKDPLPHRLGELSLEIADLINCLRPEERPRLIYIEEPSYTGDYQKGRKNRNEVNRLYMAIGALIAGVHASEPVRRPGPHYVRPLLYLVPADRTRKGSRINSLESIAHIAGRKLPTGPRGGVTGVIADQRDAIYIGWSCLLSRVEKDLTLRGGEE